MKLEKTSLIVSVILLILAVFHWSYGYYALLRLVVCGTALLHAYAAKVNNQLTWVFYALFVGVLFNPLIPVHLSREIWVFIDLAIAISFIIKLRNGNR